MAKAKCNHCSKTFIDSAALDAHKEKEHRPMASDEDLERVAKNAVWDFLTSDGADRALREKARVAGAHLSAEARKEQTRNAQIATMALIAREVSETKSDFAKTMRRIVPDLATVLELPAAQ